MQRLLSIFSSNNQLLPNMIEIDWNQLKQNSNSKEITFEKFCYQVAVAKFGEYGRITYPYNMTGSEFYLTLTRPLNYEGNAYPAGTEMCWQAKFWVNENDLENTSLAKNRRTELVEAFKNTNEAHPDMALWIVCTPGMVKEKAYQELKDELEAINPKVEITHWHKSVFESIFVEDEVRFQGIAAFFFSKSYLNNNTILSITSATLESLRQKFDVDLHSETKFEHQLIGMVDSQVAEKEIRSRLHALYERLEHYDKKWNAETRREQRGDVFKGEVLPAFEAYETFLLNLGRELCAINQADGLDVMVATGAKIFEGSYKEFEEIAKKLTAVIDVERENLNVTSFNYYVEDIKIIKDIIFSGAERRVRSVEYALSLRVDDYFPVFAQAGFGKTHFACAIASKLLNRELPVLFVAGSRFRHYARPQDAFLKLFEVDGKLTFDELLGAMDSLAACYSGARMPIIIDGLNESFPGDAAWKEDLPLLIEAIRKTKHLFLVTTCREKTEYIQRIYGLNNYEQVKGHILLEGIETTNLVETIRKYFTKYEIREAKVISKIPFKNPLLLKIFCEANKGAMGLVVNEYSLAECMKHYSNRLVENIAREDGVIDKVVKHDLTKGLTEMGEFLWERNTRTLDYWSDFRLIFNGKTENLIEEGICFQIDLNQDDSEVKFTYDMMAGYHIANYLMSCTKDSNELEALLKDQSVYKKLFGEPDELHTLSEDIVKSLVYLEAERDNNDLFDLLPEDAALSKILGNIDFICGSVEGRSSLEKRLEIPMGVPLKQSICELVKEKVVNGQSVFGVASLLPAFLQMNSEEMDMLFHSIFLGYGAMAEVVQCVKKHLQEDIVPADALAAALLFTGTFMNEKRLELIRLVTIYAETHFEQYIPIASVAVKMKDPFIREAVYLSSTGAAVRSGDKRIAEQALTLLYENMRETPTSHIVLLDMLDTLMEYAKAFHSIEMDKSVLYQLKDTIWLMFKCNWHSSIYEYDFEKYSLRPYSNIQYKLKSPYSSDDLWFMIAGRMKEKGYNDEVYAKREKELSDSRRYWQVTVRSMPCKHRDSTQKELVGWLLLKGYIEPVYKGTFRTTEIDVDPSYPAFNPLRNLDTRSYLCRGDDIEDWMKEDPMSLFEGKLCSGLPKTKHQWVLLAGKVSQENEERDNRHSLSWRVTTCLNWNTLGSHAVEDLGSTPSYLYAFEIGWREMKTTDEDYYDLRLGVPLLNRYEFSSRENERDKVPQFYFLDDDISKEMGLVFSLKDLSYYRNGEKVVEVFHSMATSFYYLRQDVIEEILEKYNVHLDFEMYANKTNLEKKIGEDGCYMDYRKTLTYKGE